MRLLRFALVLTPILGSLPGVAAQTCVSSSTTQACVSWSGPGNPTQGADFTAVIGAGGGVRIVLHTPDLGWDIVATELATGGPGDLTGIRILPAGTGGDFQVSLGNGTTPGLRNLGTIDLTSPGWSGHTNLGGGRLSGNLTSALRLAAGPQKTGGKVLGDFTVEGTTSATVDVASISSFTWFQGGFSGCLDVGLLTGILNLGSLDGEATVQVVQGGSLGCAETSGVLTVGRAMVGGFCGPGPVLPGGEVSFGDLSGSASIQFDGPVGSEIAGTVTFERGIGADASMLTTIPLGDTGIFDLNEAGVRGRFELLGGSGQILRGGPIFSPAGHAWVASTMPEEFSGTATFERIEFGGILEAEFANISGTIRILGDVEGTLATRVGDFLPGTRIEIGGDLGPHAWVGSLGTPGFFGEMHGTIRVGGDVHGLIQVNQSMHPGSGIEVLGTCDGAIQVGEDTMPGSYIALRHFGAGGWVRINDSQGPYDAAGTFYVGPFPNIVLAPVTFDGCLRVLGDGSGKFGNFTGILATIGCHDTADPLEVCLDGALMGTLLIQQPGCPLQVPGIQCSGTCP